MSTSRRRVSRLAGAVVLATLVAAPTQTSAAVAASHHRHASSASCPRELREVAATMQRLTGHVTSCSEAAALLRKNR
jgi:hypothetical protein